MKNFNTNTTNKDEWLTPPEIINALGKFDLDPCAPINRPWDTATKHYTIEDDGLSKKWEGRVWCNPPYGPHTFKWLERLADHGRGLALIFARTETRGFHEQVWNRARAIFFFQGRLCFHHADGSKGNAANAPSCLITYSGADVHWLRIAASSGKIKGKLIRL